MCYRNQTLSPLALRPCATEIKHSHLSPYVHVLQKSNTLTSRLTPMCYRNKTLSPLALRPCATGIKHSHLSPYVHVLLTLPPSPAPTFLCRSKSDYGRTWTRSAGPECSWRQPSDTPPPPPPHASRPPPLQLLLSTSAATTHRPPDNYLCLCAPASPPSPTLPTRTTPEPAGPRRPAQAG